MLNSEMHSQSSEQEREWEKDLKSKWLLYNSVNVHSLPLFCLRSRSIHEEMNVLERLNSIPNQKLVCLQRQK